MSMDNSSSLSHDSASASAPALAVEPVPLRRRGGALPPPAAATGHHQRHRYSRRCFLISLAFAVLLVTILQYMFSLKFSSDFFTSTQSSNKVLLQNFVINREIQIVDGVSENDGKRSTSAATRTKASNKTSAGEKVKLMRQEPADAEAKIAKHVNDSAAATVLIGQAEQKVSKKEEESNDPDYHVIFSSSCVPLQHWQSYLFFYSALKVGQRGNVTRIVSGCNEQETNDLMKFHEEHVRPMSDRFFVHFTPDFSEVTLDMDDQPYKYMNKPYGVRHWMENVLGLGNHDNHTVAESSSRLLDGIVMLLDPDIVLLRPLRHDFTNEQVMWATKRENDTPLTKVVRHGYPIAQQDGYLGNTWIYMNWSHITGLPKGQYLEPPIESFEDGEIYWNSGPPYLATVKDMYAIAVRWTEYSSRLLELKLKETGIYGEMFGYIIAAYQLKLRHTLVPSIVVSETESTTREGWPYIDELADDQVCRPNDDVPMSPSSPMPIGIHYCQRYMLGKYFFVKYRVKKKILDCDLPLYAMPPKDLSQRYNYTVIPIRADLKDKDTWREEKKIVPPAGAKRMAFMLCRMTAYLNDALRYYKERACDGKGNMNETLSVYIDPMDRR